MKNKLLPLLALSSLCLVSKGLAQDMLDFSEKKASVAERKFTADRNFINQHHIVVLEDGTRMEIEMYDANDFSLIKNLDSLLHIFNNDFATYKDSLLPGGTNSLRIDYLFTDKPGVQAIRFKRHDADGEMYANTKGQLSRLKLDDDTVRILISKCATEKVWGKYDYTPIQITFRSKSFADILELKNLNRVVDRLIVNALKGNKMSRHPKSEKTTIYKVQTDSLVKFEDESGLKINQNDMIIITGNIGLGVIRDRISPFAEIKLQLSKPWSGLKNARSVFGISATPYFLFEKRADGNYTTHANWFLNAEIGNVSNGLFDGLKIKSFTIGAGYLLKPTDKIFNGKTAKAYLNIGLDKGFQIAPEIIFTDNFRQMFPGITLRIFKQ